MCGLGRRDLLMIDILDLMGWSGVCFVGCCEGCLVLVIVFLGFMSERKF